MFKAQNPNIEFLLLAVHQLGELVDEMMLGRSYFKDKFEEITNWQTRLWTPGRPMIGEQGSIYRALVY